MYQNVRRERYYAMQQTIHRPGSPLGGPQQGGPRSQSIIITAITLFALSGLLVGFAFGALTIKHKPATAPVSNNQPVNKPVISQQITPTPTTILQNFVLGCPQMEASSSAYQGVVHIPGNSTTYTLAIQATDKAKGTCGNSAALQVSNITCKVWLVKHVPKGKMFNIPNDYLKAGNLAASATGQVGGDDSPEVQGITFDPTTPQTQPSNAQGQATWKYTVSPNVDSGTYDFIVLTDYQGKTFNWSWFDITVQKNG